MSFICIQKFPIWSWYYASQIVVIIYLCVIFLFIKVNCSIHLTGLIEDASSTKPNSHYKVLIVFLTHSLPKYVYNALKKLLHGNQLLNSFICLGQQQTHAPRGQAAAAALIQLGVILVEQVWLVQLPKVLRLGFRDVEQLQFDEEPKAGEPDLEANKLLFGSTSLTYSHLSTCHVRRPLFNF